MCLTGIVDSVFVPKERPIQGWRNFSMADDGRLAPAHTYNTRRRAATWYPKARIAADELPHPANNSGLYSYKTAEERLLRTSVTGVYGIVECWGWGVEHFHGHRMQYARIREVRVAKWYAVQHGDRVYAARLLYEPLGVIFRVGGRRMGPAHPSDKEPKWTGIGRR